MHQIGPGTETIIMVRRREETHEIKSTLSLEVKGEPDMDTDRKQGYVISKHTDTI